MCEQLLPKSRGENMCFKEFVGESAGDKYSCEHQAAYSPPACGGELSFPSQTPSAESGDKTVGGSSFSLT